MEFFYKSSLVWNSESQKQSASPNALNLLYLAISDMKKVKRMTGQSVPIRGTVCVVMNHDIVTVASDATPCSMLLAGCCWHHQNRAAETFWDVGTE